MKRPTINLIIDALAATLFVGMIATGYILWFALPPGTNKSLWLWGLTRHAWGQVHSGISLALLLTVLLHVALHWKWVVAVIAQRVGRERSSQGGQLHIGVLALLALVTVVALFAWVTQRSVRELDSPSRQPPASAEGAALDGGAEPSGIDFWSHVYPILEHSCIHCHGPEMAHASFRIDRRGDHLGTKGAFAFVVPGKGDESELIAIVEGRRPGMRMAASHELPAEAVAVLRAWIDAGADWPERP